MDNELLTVKKLMIIVSLLQNFRVWLLSSRRACKSYKSRKTKQKKVEKPKAVSSHVINLLLNKCAKCHTGGILALGSLFPKNFFSNVLWTLPYHPYSLFEWSLDWIQSVGHRKIFDVATCFCSQQIRRSSVMA